MAPRAVGVSADVYARPGTPAVAPVRKLLARMSNVSVLIPDLRVLIARDYKDRDEARARVKGAVNFTRQPDRYLDYEETMECVPTSPSCSLSCFTCACSLRPLLLSLPCCCCCASQRPGPCPVDARRGKCHCRSDDRLCLAVLWRRWMFLQEALHGDICSVSQVGSSHEGRPIYVLKLHGRAPSRPVSNFDRAPATLQDAVPPQCHAIVALRPWSGSCLPGVS